MSVTTTPPAPVLLPPPPRSTDARAFARVAAAGFGAVLVLGSAGLLVAGGVVHHLDTSNREGGLITTEETRVQTAGYALTTTEIDFAGLAGSWVLGDTSLRVTSTDADAPLFVGLARPADAAAYLDDVQHSTVTEVEVPPAYTEHSGGSPAGDPRASDIWTEQASGSGTQTISWPESGSWTVVVMNADGSAGIEVEADLQAEVPHLDDVAVGLFVAGALGALMGGLLLWRSLRRRPQAG